MRGRCPGSWRPAGHHPGVNPATQIGAAAAGRGQCSILEPGPPAHGRSEAFALSPPRRGWTAQKRERRGGAAPRMGGMSPVVEAVEPRSALSGGIPPLCGHSIPLTDCCLRRRILVRYAAVSSSCLVARGERAALAARAARRTRRVRRFKVVAARSTRRLMVFNPRRQ